MAINKLVLGTEVKFDLTADTITADKLLTGHTAHDKAGEAITGTCDYDANTSDATAAVAEILSGKTAYARGAKLTGTMPNNGAATGTITTKAQQYTIPMGYHDGSGKVSISTSEQAKIIAGNIKQGITILGVQGSYGGEAVSAQANKDVTPTLAQQVITPDADYDYLAQVTVAAIPVTETNNAAGGVTLTIGA